VDRFCFGGSFRVVSFLGDFDRGWYVWATTTKQNIAGSSFVFASHASRLEEDAEGGGCANCKEQQEIRAAKYSKAVFITDALLSYYASNEVLHDMVLASPEPEVVVPFLQKEPHGASSRLISPAQLRSILWSVAELTR